MWNYWQGSLDAEIMVIGQDFGIFPQKQDKLTEKQKRNKRYYSYKQYIQGKAWRQDVDLSKTKNYWGATDANLISLFWEGLEIDITKPQEKLFFTNMACCYRQNMISGSSNFRQEWLSLCANKYMGELIEIIRPKLIIALGENVWNAFGCIESARLICKDMISKNEIVKVSGFQESIQHTYQLNFETGFQVRVFPVYHPGAYSTVNRPMYRADVTTGNEADKGKKKREGCQIEDWKKIKDYYESSCRTN
ncbi:MAG: uracil-DNA glycosylase family protein [Lachnospiraceae bacterium]|nr:uracil-DNA glycosylase family protein [Lachnospiraceae bacterium]